MSVELSSMDIQNVREILLFVRKDAYVLDKLSDWLEIRPKSLLPHLERLIGKLAGEPLEEEIVDG